MSYAIGPWADSKATYDRGKSFIDGADQAAVDMEAKWGHGRLRLLVCDDLRARFDSQWRKFNEALSGGDLEEVTTQAARMRNAWGALDRAATEGGHKPIDPVVWETVTPRGQVLAIVKTRAEAFHAVAAHSGRALRVLTLEEVGRLIDTCAGGLLDALEAFPGARVVAVREPKPDTGGGWDREKGDDLPF